MSAGKRKTKPEQPELPIDEGKPDNGEAKPKPAAKGNGESHVLAEDVPAVEHHPFNPAKQELAFHRRVNTSFMEYASYVIRDRAIPALQDGLKPVQRRILWALHEKDDGRFIKVATISGHCAQYHPHGNASIDDALVVLTNKRYLIEGQGNFGNIFITDVNSTPIRLFKTPNQPQ